MRLIVGADHAGYALKDELVARLRADGHTVEDIGTHEATPVDYPAFARRVAESVVMGKAERGILVCSSGQGSSMAANKIPGARAALVTDAYSAHQSVEHDDANVLCLGAGVVGPALAWDLARAWVAARWTDEARHARRVAQIAALDRRFPLYELQRQGQSVWMDNIARGLLDSGEFRQLVRDGITGVTSNPTILEKAVAGSPDYQDATLRLAREGLGPRDIAVRLWIDDIRDAADQLRPIYDLTEGADGHASIEVDAELAHDTAGTLAEARRLWRELDRPNVMIKVPGTAEGIPAVRQLIAEGVNVNITLLFARERHDEVMEAYLAGLEERAARGLPVRGVASVASFFVSRVDTAVDRLLEERLAAAEREDEREALRALFGRAAIANAKLAYESFLQHFSGPRWEALRARGARVQRPLWASTSTKNPAYRDVLYVEELIGPDTVNTLPPPTIDAFRDHGYVRRSVDSDVAQARAELDALANLGLDLDAVTAQLQVDGVKSFADSFSQLLGSIRDEVARGSGAEPARVGAAD